MAEGLKTCKVCGFLGLPSEFAFRRRLCKSCFSEWRRERFHRPDVKAKQKVWREENKKRCDFLNRVWQLANRDKTRSYDRKSRLKREFGISPEEYESMLLSQGGVCAICGKSPSSRKLAVDHNHVTGRVRGLLCGTCNPALGGFGDSIEILKLAISYLERTDS